MAAERNWCWGGWSDVAGNFFLIWSDNNIFKIQCEPRTKKWNRAISMT